MKRRTFLKLIGTTPAIVSVAELASVGAPERNPLPRWRGFNLTDFNSPEPSSGRPGTTDDDLRWIRDWGFDFIRLPMAYPRYVDFNRAEPIKPSEVCRINEREVERIEKFVRHAQGFGLHVCINLHRAPGYCVNAGFHEPFDLWRSAEAQEAFAFHWGMWAKRFKDVSPKQISFDLLNEPSMRSDMNDQHSRSGPIPGALYRDVARKAVDAIRAANPSNLVIADGNSMGSSVTPELKELKIAQSCRGYFPGYISHYKAPWANKDPEKCPTPVWPGRINGEQFDRQRLEKFYEPWIALTRDGVGVHCGECGCWNKTPHEVFLAWFKDVLDILTEAQIGYALWNFRGDFGILDSRRADIQYTDWHGHQLDSKLLELLQAH